MLRYLDENYLQAWTTRKHYVECRVGVAFPGTTQQVPYTDFAVVHPDLPESMRQMVEFVNHQCGYTMHGVRMLHALVNHLQNPRQLPGADEKLQWVYAAKAMSYQPGSTYALLESRGYDVFPCVTTTRDTLPYVYHERLLRVPVGHLDEHYPGWKARLQIANGLELQEEELLFFVLPTAVPPAQTVDLPDLGLS